MKSKLVPLLVILALASALVACSTPEPGVEVSVVVPKVVGLSEAAARSALAKAGLKVGVITKAPYPAGSSAVVIAQEPAGQSPTTPGTAVDLVVAEPAKR